MKRALTLCGILVGIGTASADGLDRTAIASAVTQVKPKVMECGQKIKATGTIKVTVTVGPDGKVSSAKRVSGDEQLGACVVDAIKAATFKPSKSGGSFSYPFVFAAATPPAASGGGAAPPVDTGELDRDGITAGIALVKAKVAACGEKIKATGTIKVAVKVGPDGKVSSATRAAGDEKLGACVVDVIKTATFKPTSKGGAFSYPFVFGAPSTSAPPATGTGDSANSRLDRSMITDGIAAAKAQIQGCAKTSKAKGTVKLKVTVAPDGTVTSADVEAAPDPALGTCVADVLKKTTFAKTGQGGSFSYPFVF